MTEIEESTQAASAASLAEILDGENELPSVERLSSVHAVLGIRRQATEHDLLITTVLEALRSGSKDEQALLVAARGVWPGAGITAEQLLRALKIAARAGYVVSAQIDGAPGWLLTSIGQRDVEASRDWAREILDATAVELRDRVKAAGLELDEEGAQIWVHHLELALHASIRNAFAAYQGDVHRQSDWWLTPRSFNREALVASIKQTTGDSSHAAILTGLAFDAIDPLTTFGNDLVTHITIGYTLHAFMGKRDHVGVRAAIGNLTGDRVILDTPVILQLLGPSKRGSVERLVRAALGAQMEVIVLHHYLEEVRDTIVRAERDLLPGVLATLSDGVNAGLLATLVDDEVLAIWLDGLSTGAYVDWKSFADSADLLEQSAKDLGITVRGHGNLDQAAVDRVEAVIGEAAPIRGVAPRRRDAHTLVMAKRSRDRAAGQRPFWPGAWVVTPDTHMNEAYAKAFGSDDFPIALTPGRLAGLIASCSSPAQMEDLASSAAALLQEDSFLAIAARYPVPVAIGLATALGPTSGGSQLDLRLSQLTPAELMAEQPDIDASDDEVGAKVTAAVMTLRAERLNASFEAGAARQQRRADAATMTARAAEAISEQWRQTSRNAAAERDSAKRELDQARLDNATILSLRDRTWLARAGYVLGIIPMGIAVIQGNVAWVLISALALALFWRSATDWTRNIGVTWRVLLPAVVVDGLTVAIEFILQHQT